MGVSMGQYGDSKQMTAVIYARLPFRNQEQSISLRKQVSKCWDFCNKKGWKVRYVFIDQCQGCDGSYKPDFTKIVQRTHSEGPESIVFWESDKVTILRTAVNEARIGGP
jgi:DNA invertase Pin-like site-specific DNA recombinase